VSARRPVEGEGQTGIGRALAGRHVQEKEGRQDGVEPTNVQMWPPGPTGGPGVSARRPVGEGGQTDTGLVLAAQPAREKEGRQNGVTPTHAQNSQMGN